MGTCSLRRSLKRHLITMLIQKAFPFKVHFLITTLLSIHKRLIILHQNELAHQRIQFNFISFVVVVVEADVCIVAVDVVEFVAIDVEDDNGGALANVKYAV